MGATDNLPDYSEQRAAASPGSNSPSNPDEILQSVTRSLESLQQNLVVQLQQDISRLEQQKSRLIDEIESLQDQQRSLQVQHQRSLSQQQIEQQKIWAKQMAQSLANHLQAMMVQRLSQMNYLPPQAEPDSVAALPGSTPQHTQRVLASLDASLNQTLNSLSQDLNSYQSSLSQQISRMQTMQQQGEAILDVLVQRLSRQLQADLMRSQSVQPTGVLSNGGSQTVYQSGAVANGNSLPAFSGNGVEQYSNGGAMPPITNGSISMSASVPPVTQPPPAKPTALNTFQMGILVMLGSTLALSLHNVVVGIIAREKGILGLFQLGGYVTFSFGNAMLLLWLRMLVVVPLLAGVATILYPACWRDIKAFLQSSDRRLMFSSLGTGFFLFLSQISIYVAIGGVGPGVAVTILFMYPIITVPLAWILFGDRPTPTRNIVMVAIALGVVLTSLPALSATGRVEIWGIVAAVVSGVTFAFYVISMQISSRKLHPVPVSVIQFSTIFLLTSLSLIFLPNTGVDIPADGRIGFLIGGVTLGTLTLVGYLMNNFGIRLLGASRASIFSSSGPVMTALLDFLITQTALKGVQVLGIVVVTTGLIALSFEKMFTRSPANPNPTPPKTPKPVAKA
ncbi:MAG: EamA family transporter [Synechococcales cyanobacterium T60_A2020_003]|nr:EamA family transporter [Synechococcales cyanobacterium T60_A2020_003]